MMKDWERALKKGRSINQLHLRKKFKQLLRHEKNTEVE